MIWISTLFEHFIFAENPIPGACTATSRFITAASGAMRSLTKR